MRRRRGGRRPARSTVRRRRPRRRAAPPQASASRAGSGRLPCRAADWPSWLRTAAAPAPAPPPPRPPRLHAPADTERAARALEQHGADLMVLRRAPRRPDQAQRHLRIERVTPIRAVHGDGEQALIEVLQDQFVVHGFLLSLLFIIAVIPGRCEASNPESRDSGSGPSDHPGMTSGWRPDYDLTRPPRRTEGCARRQAARLLAHRRSRALGVDLEKLPR